MEAGKFMKRLITRIFGAKGHYVEIDPNDNCITLSKDLFKSLEIKSDAPNMVLGCVVDGEYAFCINPEGISPEETIVSELQYNPKYKTYGYYADCPMVSRIVHDYGLKYEVQKLRVRRVKAKEGDVVFNIIENKRL